MGLCYFFSFDDVYLLTNVYNDDVDSASLNVFVKNSKYLSYFMSWMDWPLYSASSSIVSSKNENMLNSLIKTAIIYDKNNLDLYYDYFFM